MKPNRDAEFQALYDHADTMGRHAAMGTTPVPMVVGREVIDDGACGFGWVNIKPATSAFAKWLKARHYASPDGYYGGVTIWISDYNQSMVRKEVHAYAMAKVLTEAGYKATGHSRMD